MFSYGFRYQFSDRHFRGRHEEPERQANRTQVENRILLSDFALTYGISPRTAISFAVPYLVATRTGVNRDFPGSRYEQNVTGIGDLTIVGRRLMMDPATSLDRNVTLGFGLKFPTGAPDETYPRRALDDNGDEFVDIRVADQSVQPGDGGFGFLVDASAFRQLGHWTIYGSGSYLFNPDNTNGVLTGRRRENESVMSVADQYVARAGLTYTAQDSLASWGLGGRIEGVPARDAIGREDGFRRPGYAISVEPSFSYQFEESILTVSTPIAVVRNRIKSVQDIENGRHGDAAFADWVLLIGWTVRL